VALEHTYEHVWLLLHGVVLDGANFASRQKGTCGPTVAGAVVAVVVGAAVVAVEVGVAAAVVVVVTMVVFALVVVVVTTMVVVVPVPVVVVVALVAPVVGFGRMRSQLTFQRILLCE
jgi:hypothetical protein